MPSRACFTRGPRLDSRMRSICSNTRCGRAAIALHQFPARCRPCAPRSLGSRSRTVHAAPRSSAEFTCDGRAGLQKFRRHFAEIFHRRAENRNFAERRRLKNVVSAGGNERAADEDARRRRDTVRPVRQDYRADSTWTARRKRQGCQNRSRTRSRRRSRLRPDCATICRGIVKLLRLARRQHEKRLRKFALDVRKCFQNRGLFVRRARFPRPPRAAICFSPVRTPATSDSGLSPVLAQDRTSGCR